jgi:alpha,alpha-trehalase
VVVEDASSGVKAGRNGGFGLVIGIARKDNTKELLSNGADVVVDDLDKIDLDWIENWFHKKPLSLSKYWKKEPEELDAPKKIPKEPKNIAIHPSYKRSGAQALLDGKNLVFFLDYDGTLTPIVDRPDLAVISQEAKEVLENLSKKYTVAIVSGRSREDVESLVGLKGICFAGSHGFDIRGPKISMIEPRAKETIPLITDIVKVLQEKLKDIPGILIEEKRFSVAVHYRLVDEAKYLSLVKGLVDELVSSNVKLRLMQGKKVYEILPAIDWDKGQAIRWLVKALNTSWDKDSIIYIGDDTTDEDAFRTIRTRGTTILVSESCKESAADFFVSNPKEVKKLFEKII